VPVKQSKGQTDKEKIEKALEAQDDRNYVLRLYVAGMTPKSTLAVTNIKKICEEHLAGRYSLEVIDLYKRPALADGEQIIAAPTLLKKLPLPLRRFIGDMSNTEKIIVGLDLRPKKK
jgi:circadian clock protein KaiB